jgi:hypothetical protein
MNQPRFLHHDIVRLAGQEELGTVKEVAMVDHHFVYQVQVGNNSDGTRTIPESDLELVKIANNEETGFALRYIS